MVHEIITKRFSPRAFSDKPVEEDKIIDLFEAARWSPSSRNEQPWRFIYATKDDSEGHKKIANILNENNKIWAESAPLLILAIAKLDFDMNKQINTHALYDLGAAVAFLTAQATVMDLYVHQMGGFNPYKAREYFEIPDNFDPGIVLAIGYKGDPESLPGYLRIRETAMRKRRDLSQIVFTGKFGQKDKLFSKDNVISEPENMEIKREMKLSM